MPRAAIFRRRTAFPSWCPALPCKPSVQSWSIWAGLSGLVYVGLVDLGLNYWAELFGSCPSIDQKSGPHEAGHLLDSGSGRLDQPPSSGDGGARKLMNCSKLLDI